MGHSWREMDPKGADEHDRRIERRNRIWTRLENLPLSCFTFGEFRILRRFIEERGYSETDLSYLEEKIDDFLKKHPVYCFKCGAIRKEHPKHKCKSEE